MFGFKRIMELERDLKYMGERHAALLGEVRLLQGDVDRITDFLGASFQNVHERRLVKKGGHRRKR